MKRSPNKFGARKIKLDGHTFDSALEAQVYETLKQLLQEGSIRDLVIHPAFALEVNGIKVAPRPYRADFQFFDERARTLRILDVKGYDEPYCKLRRKVAEAVNGIAVELIRRDRKSGIIHV